MSEIKNVLISEIKTNPFQPRSHFDDVTIKELAYSIKENGLVQPVTLRKISSNSYELIAGERRLRACLYLNEKTIPAFVVETTNDESMYMALIENIQRENLSSIEEAKAYMQIMNIRGMTQSELAKKIGKSQSSVANKIRLLNLDINVQNAVEAKLISERHARALLSLNKKDQNIVLEKIINEQLSVSQTEKFLKSRKEDVISNAVKKCINEVEIGVKAFKQAKKMIEKNGLKVDMEEKEFDNYIEMVFKIKK